MKAWQVTRHGDPVDVLKLAEVPIPTLTDGQLLVRVLAAAANFPDVLMCQGTYQVRPPLPFTPGVELCGEVVEAGGDEFAAGDRVIGGVVLPSGGFAEYALMPAGSVMPAPAALDDAEAAPFHITYQTGWFGLHQRAHLQPGETLLVHAAAGGVGSGAVQLGKAAGARVIGVVGGPEKAAVARELGADVVVDRHSEDFVAVVKDVTDGRGADVVYDSVGGDAFRRSTKCIAFEGRIVIVGFAGGSIPAPGLNHALVKNYSILGLHWGLYKQLDPGSVWAAHEALVKLADEGGLRPLISERIPVKQAVEGLTALGGGATTGRVVVVPGLEG